MGIEFGYIDESVTPRRERRGAHSTKYKDILGERSWHQFLSEMDLGKALKIKLNSKKEATSLQSTVLGSIRRHPNIGFVLHSLTEKQEDGTYLVFIYKIKNES